VGLTFARLPAAAYRPWGDADTPAPGGRDSRRGPRRVSLPRVGETHAGRTTTTVMAEPRPPSRHDHFPLQANSGTPSAASTVPMVPLTHSDQTLTLPGRQPAHVWPSLPATPARPTHPTRAATARSRRSRRTPGSRCRRGEPDVRLGHRPDERGHGQPIGRAPAAPPTQPRHRGAGVRAKRGAS
jgi:hypothetical protein